MGNSRTENKRKFKNERTKKKVQKRGGDFRPNIENPNYLIMLHDGCFRRLPTHETRAYCPSSFFLLGHFFKKKKKSIKTEEIEIWVGVCYNKKVMLFFYLGETTNVIIYTGL